MEVVPSSDLLATCLPCYLHVSPYQNRHQHLTPDTSRSVARPQQPVTVVASNYSAESRGRLIGRWRAPVP
jgi:hypothetical protein